MEEVLQEKYSKYDKHGLFPEIVKAVDVFTQKQNKNLTIEKFLTAVKEIYLHSLQKDPSKVDMDFAEWFLGLMTE